MNLNIMRMGILGLIICAWASWLHADRIVLKGGYEITGDVLKSDSKVVIVDIGCEVLHCPVRR